MILSRGKEIKVESYMELSEAHLIEKNIEIYDAFQENEDLFLSCRQNMNRDELLPIFSDGAAKGYPL